MSNILRLLLVASVIAIVIMFILHPTQLRELGRKARLVAYLWVLAVLIGAVLQLAGLRGY
jgi:hypothetical protein